MARIAQIQAATNFSQCCKAIERMINSAKPGEFSLDDALRLETSGARIRELIINDAMRPQTNV